MQDFENKEIFFKNESCPLCGGKEFKPLISNYKNVYSELISKHINFEENYFLRKNTTFKCENCSITFWKYAIGKKLRRKLYNSILPSHPKGIDSSGKFFNFHSMVERLKKAEEYPNKKKRIIEGYIGSMIFENNSEKEEISKVLFDNILITAKNNLFENIFKRGAKYLSRYSGFRKTIINQLILNIFEDNKNISNYIEYGCTSWGPINSILEKGFQCLSIIPSSDIFWNCIHHANETNYKNYNIIYEKDIKHNSIYFKNSILTLILVLDHVEYPLDFLIRFIKKGVKFIFIILETIVEDGNLPIQHLTGWDKTSLIYLSEKIGAKIEFIDIGSNLFTSALIKIK